MKLLNLQNIGAALAVATSQPTAFPAQPRSVSIQANFTYDSGGATVDAYVQTTLDGGATWCDVANFHFTTASGIKQMNVCSSTPVLAARTPTDGSLAANTAVDGVMGPQWRVKYVTTGTYGGASALSIDVATDQARN